MCSTSNGIDTKICKACLFEKSTSEFPPKGYKDGKQLFRAYCRKCFWSVKKSRMSEDQLAAKRKRDSECIRSEKGKARSARMYVRRKSNTRISLIPENVGAYCLVQWHTCNRCNRKQYLKNRHIESDKCLRCKRDSFHVGPNKVKESICPRCGEVHMAKVRISMCKKCVLVSAKERQRVYNEARGGKDRNILDRVRRHGVYREYVNRSKVYERDGYKCYLCGISVVLSKSYRPDQATLDHVMPLSKGGTHTYDNIKTCCHVCNSRKSNKVDQIVNDVSYHGTEGRDMQAARGY